MSHPEIFNQAIPYDTRLVKYLDNCVHEDILLRTHVALGLIQSENDLRLILTSSRRFQTEYLLKRAEKSWFGVVFSLLEDEGPSLLYLQLLSTIMSVDCAQQVFDYCFSWLDRLEDSPLVGLMIRELMSKHKSCIDVQQIWPLIVKNEKLGLNLVCYFLPELKLGSSDGIFLLQMITRGFESTDCVIVKQAQFALRMCVSCERLYGISQEHAMLFLDLHGVISEFQIHLLEAVWEQLNVFIDFVDNPIILRWVRHLVLLTLDSDNPIIRRFALNWLVCLDLEPSTKLFAAFGDRAFSLDHIQTRINDHNWYRTARPPSRDPVQEIDRRVTSYFSSAIRCSADPVAYMQDFVHSIALGNSRNSSLFVQVDVFEHIGTTKAFSKTRMNASIVQDLRTVFSVHCEATESLLRLRTRSILLVSAVNFVDLGDDLTTLCQLLESLPATTVTQTPLDYGNLVKQKPYSLLHILKNAIDLTWLKPLLMEYIIEFLTVVNPNVQLCALLVSLSNSMVLKTAVECVSSPVAMNLFRLLGWLQQYNPAFFGAIRLDPTGWLSKYIGDGLESADSLPLVLETFSDTPDILGNRISIISRTSLTGDLHYNLVLLSSAVTPGIFGFAEEAIGYQLLDKIMVIDERLPRVRDSSHDILFLKWECVHKLLSELSIEQMPIAKSTELTLSVVETLDGCTLDFVIPVMKSLCTLMPYSIFSSMNTDSLWETCITSALKVFTEFAKNASNDLVISVLNVCFPHCEFVLEKRHSGSSYGFRDILKQFREICSFNWRFTECLIRYIMPCFIANPRIGKLYVEEIASLAVSCKTDSVCLLDHSFLELPDDWSSTPVDYPRSLGQLMVVTFLEDLIHVADTDTDSVAMIDGIIVELIRIIRLGCKGHLASFLNSSECTKLLFAWEAMALFVPVIHRVSEATITDIYNLFCEELLIGMHPSIRQLMDAFGVGFFVACPNMFKEVLLARDLNNLIRERGSVRVSLLIVVGFTSSNLLTEGVSPKGWFDHVVTLLSVSMISNVGLIRSISQSILHMLFSILSSEGCLADYVDARTIALWEFQRSDPDLLKNWLEIENCFSAFNYTRICSLQGIHDIQLDVNKVFSMAAIEQCRPIISDYLSSLRTTLDDYYGVAREEASLRESRKMTIRMADFQQKISPVQDLFQKMYDEQSEGSFRMMIESSERNKSRQKIVLFASLIEKVPNIAGLSRTSEIMHIEKMVIHDLRVIKKKEFQSISVTSENWIPMEQVPNLDIDVMIDYLQSYRLKGYTIIALEQTSNSVSLDEFEFPEKVVLVLGKEKEGVPFPLLQVVDYSVEIPQFGIIRSLNVHVSGALCLWEYTRQRLEKLN